MGYQVLARKYRPQRFSDVAGQDHVTRTLMNALTQNRIAHGYIFSGHRGIGKTTIARILAMALNCRETVGSEARPTAEPCLKCISCREISSGGAADAGNEAMQSFDFIEIDAASNRGIDDVRSIRAEATVQPARDRYKIFLLDEAHQITEAAFNAILKTLEEPPEWAIFMLATTQPEDIPQTIRSRCQHFSFHAVKFEDILAQLQMIAEKEGLDAEEGALALLAEAGDGSMRDALSIMDQAIASAPIEADRPKLATAQIRELMGSVPNVVYERLLEAVASGQSAELMTQLNLLLNAGHNPSSLARQMARYLRNTLMAKLGGAETDLLQISGDERARAARTALLFTEEEITRNLQIVLRTFDDLNYRQEQRFHLELGLLKLIHAQRLLPMEELLSGVASGVSARSAAPAPAARPAASPARPVAHAAPAPAPALSPFSPVGGGWNAGPKMDSAPKPTMAAAPIATMERPATAAAVTPSPAPSPFQGSTPFAASATPAAGYGSAEALTEGALARAPQVAEAAAVPPDIESIRQGVVTALTEAGHESAAQLLGAGAWKLDGSSLRVEVAGMGKKMLALTVNAAAEKVIRQELQRLGAPARFLVVPGEGTAQSAAPMATPLAGSIQESALANPLVQQAKELFKAEIRSVVDLRQK
jgi:DNA polymerase-3 subunit gamma/tau